EQDVDAGQRTAGGGLAEVGPRVVQLRVFRYRPPRDRADGHDRRIGEQIDQQGRPEVARRAGQADVDRATSKACRTRSMWASVCVAITDVRRRALPGGTAGARAQLVNTPWSTRTRQVRAASQSSP